MKSQFNKYPSIKLPEKVPCYLGWERIVEHIQKEINRIQKEKKIVVVEYYHGIDEEEFIKHLIKPLHPEVHIDASTAMKPEDEIKNMVFPDVTDDEIFGFMTRLQLTGFYDKKKVKKVKKEIQNRETGTLLVTGFGASLLCDSWDILIYADMARWEIQQRMRRGEVNNIGVKNKNEPFSRLYKQGYFVDWRVCDRLKKKHMNKWDYIIDSNISNTPKMIHGKDYLQGLKMAVNQPFSVVPFFDPGPWGGQWMKEVCDLDSTQQNYAWCFNCVPEENSLLFKIGETLFETPSINLVFYQPRQLLGEAVHARFGDEFPIRFDFLDTMDGGNLSLQVHPITEYIQEQFGIHYTQDESYYLMDCNKEAKVYLGLKEGVDKVKMIADLKNANNGGTPFDADKYAESWPVKKHDHVLIPAGTVHCSGKGCMVLEISATPYIFTFKLWDWGRLGLDGKPRPINIDHGANVIQWDRVTSWTNANLINQVEVVNENTNWIEEKTGLHDREFIETRRHWSKKKVLHQTNGGVNVLCLVEGEQAIVECPENTFAPFVVNYAETFIVPANVKSYTVRPYGNNKGETICTIKAYVRT